jgi:hypothetical protein
MFQADQIARDQHPVLGRKLEIEPDLNEVDVFFFRSLIRPQSRKVLAALAGSS